MRRLICVGSVGLLSSLAYAEPVPTLDELLGLEPEPAAEAEQPGDAGEAVDPARQELDRRLSGEQAAEQFAQAIQLMRDTTERLTKPGGTGIQTQRLQEDILKKLDLVISSAEQNNSSSSSSSSSSQQQQQQQQNQPRQQQAQSESNPAGSESEGESMPPSDPNARPGPQAIADAAAWGALPERLRESLVEGASDRFSSIYQRLTEAYYRRLAEEGRRE